MGDEALLAKALPEMACIIGVSTSYEAAFPLKFANRINHPAAEKKNIHRFRIRK